MRKSLKIMLPVMVLFMIGLIYGFQYFSMVFADSADYTERDRKEYNFYTPELLKNLPRVSDVYSFHYSNVSGPNPALIYQARFSGTTDTSKINTFLEKNGFKKTGMCSSNGNCWMGKDPDITISVGLEDNPSAIHVVMIDKVGYN
ncbi:hypothetical protein CIG19_13735 [Enterobacterales bacterium CwR94]|nr:hypothetical protein CIG19_13735 [Enterobacterales bacterium CwR94]